MLSVPLKIINIKLFVNLYHTYIMKNIALIFSLLFLLLAACGKKKETKQEQTAEESSKEMTDKNMSPTLPDGEYQIQNASMKWLGSKKVGDSHYGTIDITKGLISINGGEIKGTSFEIDMNTIIAEDLSEDAKMKAKLEGHLKSEDFFEVSSYPTAKFEMTSVAEVTEEIEHTCAKDGDHAGCVPCAHAMVENSKIVNLTGNLTLKGKTNTISFPLMIAANTSGSITTKAKFTFDRTKWGVEYGSANFFKLAADKIINNDIQVSFTLEVQKI